MATQTRTRRPSSNRQGQARFTRGNAAPARRTPLRPKRRPEQSGLKKLVGGILPTGRGKKGGLSKGSNKGKLGGLGAVLAAGAGLAFKNRDKLSQLRNRDRNATPAPVEPAVPPVNVDSSGSVH
jgi:hypothetical protein